MSATGGRQLTIDYLRGIAALMVCLCHFRHAFPLELREFLRVFGELGVQVFFVISGYIIPYSLFRSHYKLSLFHKFWAKRLLRLQPPLWAALALTFALSMAAARYKHIETPFKWGDFIYSLFYLHVPDENPVVWTLIVEIKYYFYISILYPLLFSGTPWIRYWTFCVFSVLSPCLAKYYTVLSYIPYFHVGFAACYLAVGYCRMRTFILLMLVAALSLFPYASLIQALTALITSFLIVLLPAFSFPFGLFYGRISYSLYLVHFPVGVKFFNLSESRFPGISKLLLFPLSLLLSTGVSVLIYKSFEEWATWLAARVNMKGPPKSSRIQN